VVYFPQVFSVLSFIRAICPAHHILLYFITQTIFGEQYRSWSPSLCSFFYSLFTSSLLGQNIHNTLFYNTLGLRFSLSVSDQVSHPYKTTGKIAVLCILIFIFWDSKLEDKWFCTLC
jgi:hypothetical protein